MPKASNTKGVSFVERVTKTKTKTAARVLLAEYEAGKFTARNPRTLRRNRRALRTLRAKIAAKKK